MNDWDERTHRLLVESDKLLDHVQLTIQESRELVEQTRHLLEALRAPDKGGLGAYVANRRATTRRSYGRRLEQTGKPASRTTGASTLTRTTSFPTGEKSSESRETGCAKR
jgi:hypothetical protein